MHEHPEQRAWLTLIRTPGLGSTGLRQLLDVEGGDAQAALERARRHGPPVPASARAAAGEWLRQPEAERLDADQHWLAQPGRRLLCCTDEDFPPQLEDIAQPPAALFVAGDPGLLLRPQVAVVGARAASPGGRANAAAFARGLAAAGLVVTSGLAEGIDGAAHEAVLEAGGATVAVVGTGPDVTYPRRHAVMAEAIAARGALVSEFAPGTGPRPAHFPGRNRIIAGLALGTLVVEAGLRSGSLITARLAGESGREVFALPGSIHHPLARGCHRLIRDGARLVETLDEVRSALAPLAQALGSELAERLQDAGTPSAAAGGHARDAEYARLLDALGHDPLALDELAARTGLATRTISSMLLMLELEGEVASRPGGRYQRLAGS